MPRNGQGVYSKPAGTTASPNTTIESAKFNSVVDDFVQDANAPRPKTAGGTGSATSEGAANNIEVVSFAAAQTLTADQKTRARQNIALDAYEVIRNDIISTPVANYDVSDLGGYKRIEVRGRLYDTSGPGAPYLRASSDNGATFLDTASSYITQYERHQATGRASAQATSTVIPLLGDVATGNTPETGCDFWFEITRSGGRWRVEGRAGGDNGTLYKVDFYAITSAFSGFNAFRLFMAGSMLGDVLVRGVK